MKLNNITIADKTYPIVIANVFDTNNTFRAMIVLDGYTPKVTDNNQVIPESICLLRGVNIDYSDLEMNVSIDWNEQNGDWSLVYVYAQDRDINI